MTVDFSKPLPQSVEAERAVIGSVLLDDDAMDDCAELMPDSFARPQNGELWAAMTAMRARGRTIDRHTLQAELEQRGTLDKVGGPLVILELLDETATPKAVRHYAAIVRDTHRLRGLFVACEKAQRLVHASDMQPGEILEAAQGLIARATEYSDTDARADLTAIIPDLFEALSQRHDPRIKTGLHALDRITGGLEPASMVVVAARPSIGKSSFALSVIRHLLLAQSRKVALFSLEVPRLKVAQNLLCNIGKVDTRHAAGRTLNPGEEDALLDASEALERCGGRFIVDDRNRLTPETFRAQVRALAREGVDVVFLDYLQLMRGAHHLRRENRVAQLEHISHEIKHAARETGIPIVALAQIGRAGESRGNKPPRMSDLKGSGAIEEDADLVLLLHREEFYRPDDLKVQGQADVIVAKNRNGGTGTAHMAFRKHCVRFEDN